MNKKGFVVSTLIVLILFAIVLLLVIDIYTDGSIRKSIQEAIDELFILEDTDPTIWSRNFYQGRSDALKHYALVTNVFQQIAKSPQKTCFATFPLFPDDFFEREYALQFNKEGDGMSIIMLQWREDMVSSGKKEVENFQPVSNAVKIQGFEPCIVQGKVFVDAFYEDVLLNGELDVDKEYGKGVQQMTMYPENELQIKTWKEELDFFPGDGIKQYVVLKNDKKLCVIPTYPDDPAGCNAPKFGLLNEDCLDEDKSFLWIKQNNKIKLPNRLKNFLNDVDKSIYLCEGFVGYVALHISLLSFSIVTFSFIGPQSHLSKYVSFFPSLSQSSG